ncbi:hypothetical protein [Candidatus Cytomitobacter primus]|uniref:Uncharacterized protein n=1 Tax=Candidatus Cytomitobacter primus TaxID=2066024 RepID=A0A5C0UER5_9PROT|nr:hypothetical protein [Candidatus Cytomitobacter primus]QEK38586.1 hypothetical protein FZC34_01525 [Candidatus Cytomitobacter primus]
MFIYNTDVHAFTFNVKIAEKLVDQGKYEKIFQEEDGKIIYLGLAINCNSILDGKNLTNFIEPKNVRKRDFLPRGEFNESNTTLITYDQAKNLHKDAENAIILMRSEYMLLNNRHRPWAFHNDIFWLFREGNVCLIEGCELQFNGGYFDYTIHASHLLSEEILGYKFIMQDNVLLHNIPYSNNQRKLSQKIRSKMREFTSNLQQ